MVSLLQLTSVISHSISTKTACVLLTWGTIGKKNVALEEYSISEIMYAYSHTIFHIWRTGICASCELHLSIYPEHANKLCHESLIIFCF
jgi:hypothetical protein